MFLEVMLERDGFFASKRGHLWVSRAASYKTFTTNLMASILILL